LFLPIGKQSFAIAIDRTPATNRSHELFNLNMTFDEPPVAGRYRLRRRIGQGSIAEVFAATDERTGAEVALKVLYPNLHDNQVVADRFRREVQVVRRIVHPHVIRIDDLAYAERRLCLVMELHPGGDLADRLQQGPLPPAALRTLAGQICGALEAAHRAGVVHRDVKPQNILSVRTPTGSTPASATSASPAPPTSPASPPAARCSAPPTTWPRR
jgi:serine/threonine protein kinase